MKTISLLTAAGHSAFHRLILMITLYLGLGLTAHQKPEVKRSRNASMTTPDRIDDDELTNGININDDPTSMNATQQNARAYPGGNQRKSEKKMRQLRQLLSTNEGPGTADEKRCTQHQNDIIYNEKEHPRTTPVTPTVVTQVETCECLEKASLLINSHGAAELPDDDGVGADVGADVSVVDSGVDTGVDVDVRISTEIGTNAGFDRGDSDRFSVYADDGNGETVCCDRDNDVLSVENDAVSESLRTSDSLLSPALLSTRS